MFTYYDHNLLERDFASPPKHVQSIWAIAVLQTRPKANSVKCVVPIDASKPMDEIYAWATSVPHRFSTAYMRWYPPQAFEGMKAARELETQQAAQLKEEQQARDGDEQKASGVDVKTARGTEANTVRHGQPKHQHDQQSGNSRNSKKRGKRARQRNKR